jgi:hypothetical protein
MLRRLFLLTLLFATSAEARVYDLYRADLPKSAFCSAIGGACSADPDLESGFYQNPASLTAGEPSWNFDFDYNGTGNTQLGAKSSNSVYEGNYSGGMGWNHGDWGIAIAFIEKQSETDSSVSVTDSRGLTQNFPLVATSTSLDVRIPLSYRINPRLSLGFALSATFWNQGLAGGNGSRAVVTRQSSPIRWVARLGGIYHEPNSNWSYGSWFKMPATRYTHITFDTLADSNSLHYDEDIALHDPWVWALGSRWTPWSDERALMADFRMIGPTPMGYQLTYDTFAAAFGESRLHTKGRTLAYEPRLGYQMPTHFKEGRKSLLMMGTFYEGARSDGPSGRIHFTGGLSYEIFSGFEVMIGGDVAKNFTQLFLTFR